MENLSTESAYTNSTSTKKQKKVFIIAPQFYGYEKAIIDHLEKKNYCVYYINPSIDKINVIYNFLYKYVKCFNSTIDEYYYRVKLEEAPNEVDDVFIIYSRYVSEELIKKIKGKYPTCRYILYFWDSISNNAAALSIVNYFDKILTFDSHDSEKYDWIYRPLFYIEEFLVNNNRKIDVSFIGSVHSNRISIANKLRDIGEMNSLTCSIMLYSRRFMFYIKKYLIKDPLYKNANSKNFIFRSLNLKKTYEIYGSTKIVLDYVYPNQIGLTMRTIEALASGCFLLTNNKNIKKEDIFDDNTIYVYDENDLTIPDRFLKYEGDRHSFVPSGYSLDHWLDEVFL